MPGPFAIDEQPEDDWSLTGTIGSFVYPGVVGLAGWGARRGAVSLARGGGFWSGVFGGGAYNSKAFEAAEKAFAKSASYNGLHSGQAGRAFLRGAGARSGVTETWGGRSYVPEVGRTPYVQPPPKAPVGSHRWLVEGKELRENLKIPSSRIEANQMSAAEAKIAARANRSAKIFKAGTIAKGAMRMMNIYLMANVAIDIGEAATSAALGYRPRSSASPASEFGTFNPLDSSGAYTMRQRSIAAIHDSYLSTRAAIGNEASFMHR